MTKADAVGVAKPGDASEHAKNLDRLLVVKNWTGSLGLILFWIAVSFFLFGYWIPYWRFADMDIMMVHQGFLLNDGKPQYFFYHPGHLHVVLTEAWMRLLHALGVLDVVALSQIPPASDAAGFDRVWTAAVRSTRVLSLLISLSFVAAFAFLVRRLVADWRIAIIATVMLGFSSAVMWQTIQLRTDLLSAGLNIIGLLLLLNAARSPGSRLAPARHRRCRDAVYARGGQQGAGVLPRRRLAGGGVVLRREIGGARIDLAPAIAGRTVDRRACRAGGACRNPHGPAVRSRPRREVELGLSPSSATVRDVRSLSGGFGRLRGRGDRCLRLDLARSGHGDGRDAARGGARGDGRTVVDDDSLPSAERALGNQYLRVHVRHGDPTSIRNWMAAEVS